MRRIWEDIIGEFNSPDDIRLAPAYSLEGMPSIPSPIPAVSTPPSDDTTDEDISPRLRSICTNFSKKNRVLKKLKEFEIIHLLDFTGSFPNQDMFESWASAVHINTRVLNKGIFTKVREISDATLAAEISMMDLTYEPVIEDFQSTISYIKNLPKVPLRGKRSKDTVPSDDPKRLRVATEKQEAALIDGQFKVLNVWENTIGLLSKSLNDINDSRVADEEKNSVKLRTIRGMSKSAGTLRTKANNFTRFVEWCNIQRIPFIRISSVELSVFLEDAKRKSQKKKGGHPSNPDIPRGATIPSGLLSSLKWWNRLAEIKLPCDSPIVKAVIIESLDEHEAAKTTPFTQEIAAHLEWLCIESENSYIKVGASWLCLLIQGCLRWSDLQRLTPGSIGLSSDAIFATSRKTKTSKKMNWAATRIGITQKDWGLHAWEAIASKQKSADFFLPRPKKGFTSFDWNKPATPYHAKVLLRQCLMAKPLKMSFKEASSYTLHSPRFFLPTASGAFDFPMEKRCFVGHWKVGSEMPVSYDRGFCTTELNIKTEINKYFHNGYRLHDLSSPGIPKLTPEVPLLPEGAKWTQPDAHDPSLLETNTTLEDNSGEDGFSDGESPIRRAVINPDSKIGGSLRSTRQASHDLLACDSVPNFAFGSTVIHNIRSDTVHTDPSSCAWKAKIEFSRRISSDDACDRNLFLCGTCFNLRVHARIDEPTFIPFTNSDESENEINSGSEYFPSESESEEE